MAASIIGGGRTWENRLFKQYICKKYLSYEAYYPEMNIMKLLLMNIISCYKLLLILITQAIHVSEQINHINELSSIDACKGKDVVLLWKVDEEEDKISKLEWYFNNNMICTSLPVGNFIVTSPYHGRIERMGKTEILLKNVSIDDEGIYNLFPMLAGSTSQKMHKIVLRILEPPTNKCTCNIGYQPDFTSELTTSYCGRPQVSLVWKRKQTFEVLGEGNHILNSTLQDKELLCCQDGEAMKCVDDNRQYCTTASIPHQENERPSEDGNTQCTDLVTMPGTDTGSTNIHHMQPIVLATLIVCFLTAVLVFVLFIKKLRKRKKHKYVGEESLSMLEVNCKMHEPVIKDDPRLETKEAITVLKAMNDSEANIVVQTLQHSKLYPKHEKASTLNEHQYSTSLETMTAALCKMCFVKEMSVVFMPCGHSVTCAFCSIPLKQCPVCGVLIKMKMNICSD